MTYSCPRRRGGTDFRYEYQQTDNLDNLRTACRCGEKLDSLGNVVALLPGDDLRNLVQQNAYDPWGLNLPDLERSAVLPDWWQFSTKERDHRAYDEFEFRHYDAAIGRFMSIDPLFQQFRGISPFNYADNNPSTFIDLYGLQAVDPILLQEVVIIGKRTAPVLRNVVAGYGAGAGGALIQSYPLNRISADISNLNRNLQQPGRVTVSENKGNSIVSDSDIGAQNGGGSVFSSAVPIALTAAAADGPIPIGDAIGAVILAGATAYDATQRTFVTYTMRNAAGQVYVGRTSGYGDPYNIMMNRASGHHMKAFGYGNPELDGTVQGYQGYPAIRGREQQLMDFYGGVGSPGVGNRIRGVSPLNPAYPIYHGASNLYFGPLAPYTGL